MTCLPACPSVHLSFPATYPSACVRLSACVPVVLCDHPGSTLAELVGSGGGGGGGTQWDVLGASIIRLWEAQAACRPTRCFSSSLQSPSVRSSVGRSVDFGDQFLWSSTINERKYFSVDSVASCPMMDGRWDDGVSQRSGLTDR